MNSRTVWIFTGALAATALLPVLPHWAALDAQQATGRIVGRVIDANTGRGLPDAGVRLTGTSLGAVSQGDGRFSVGNVPPGLVAIQVRLIGYAPKTVTGIQLRAGQTIEQDVTLDVAAIQLEGSIVTAQAERGSVSAALDAQRNALNVVSAVTAEQIARSPDSDAAAAVQRVSGVTVQDGKFVFVRGLGERYTTTSLNGARIPSPEPEKKVVPLDLFPAGLLQSIVTSKTFTPDLDGDFSGASVDLVTREFPFRRTATYSASIGMNTATTGKMMLADPKLAREYLGFAGADRELPELVRAAGNFQGGVTQNQMNGMIRTFRNSWTPVEERGLPNSSFAMSIGGNDGLLGRQIGYVASLTYSLAQEARANMYQARANLDPVTRGTYAENEFRGELGRLSVLWGGLLNLSTFLGNDHRLSLNTSYSRTADSEASVDEGFDENLAGAFRRSTLRYVERGVWASQLRGQHTLGERHLADWSLTASRVSRREPDRSDLVYFSDGGTAPYEIYISSADGARRTFAGLAEQSYDAGASWRYVFGDPAINNGVKFGAAFRATDRDADNFQYGIIGSVSGPSGQLSAEEIFDGRFTADGQSILRIAPQGQAGSYSARDRITAGYVMADVGLTQRLRLIGGARVELADVEVTTVNFFNAREAVVRNETDILPSLGVIYRLRDDQNLRFSVSQTLARPEYRELSPILFRDVLGSQAYRGDTSLVRTLIQNVDLRWEWYMSPGEIFSLALFGKRFDRPIEQVEVPTSGTSTLSWTNAEEAFNYGIEIELRKSLNMVAGVLEPFTAFANATFMRSDISFVESEFFSVTNFDRPLVGQAPYVVNAGLTYANDSGRLSATTLYNLVGKRVFAAGADPLPDVYELPRHVLDFSLRFPVLSTLDGKLDVKNILDEPYVRRQGSVDRLRYTSGRGISVGLSWRR